MENKLTSRMNEWERDEKNDIKIAFFVVFPSFYLWIAYQKLFYFRENENEKNEFDAKGKVFLQLISRSLQTQKHSQTERKIDNNSRSIF